LAPDPCSCAWEAVAPQTAASFAAGAGWLHEPKLDGYRLQIVKSGRAVRLFSRNGHEWTKRLAALADALAAIPARSAVIDAELVAQDANGRPNFPKLHLRRSDGAELAVFAFDLLHRDGVDLCPLPLSKRKDLLADVVRHAGVDCLQLVATFPDGAKLLASAERMKLEGVVSKRRGAPYRSGECKDWRKVKTAVWREANRERWRLFERR
jgi:bifunctional non-homologous end joining protein LigD